MWKSLWSNIILSASNFLRKTVHTDACHLPLMSDKAITYLSEEALETRGDIERLYHQYKLRRLVQVVWLLHWRG